MITAVVLAAGTSTRMGTPKQLLELRGRPLLQHTVDLAAERFDDVVLVLGHRAEDIERALALPGHVRVVVNRDFERGLATSLRAGLAAVDRKADAAAVFLGDQPTMPRSLIDEVIAAFEVAGASVVRPGTAEAPGHPVLVRRDRFEQWQGLDGEEGARRLMRGPDVVFIETSIPRPDDVDTPEDYERIRHDG